MEKSGSYIIVCSKGSTSDLALQNRRRAMAKAVGDAPNAHALALDFYDRKRLETWLRNHPAQFPWVRERIGKPLQGWSSFGTWSYPTTTASDEYLLDDHVRIRVGGQRRESGLSAVAGIGQMRMVLARPQGIVRLAGLSGTGKTRLAQALFDQRVGQDSLDPFIAIYTNLGDSPNPQPVAVAEELISLCKRGILIVDNCPPELHKRLSDQCRTVGSKLSVMTIEYDIQEDQPEGTDTFVLEPSSIEIIEKLVKHRFPGISPVDARKIAEFSGGNARIAIALAGRIDKDETIAQLTDYDLFSRLFHQRHQPDNALFVAAQSLSLVYSFQGENVSNGGEAELSPLGSLVGISAHEMFKHCAELERRGLIQRRGPWRAVLPHAIANRLAALALQNIHPSAISGCFLVGGRERLLRSFSRRLGYLNGSKEAESIVAEWLSPSGLLKDFPDLNDLGDAIFQNIAPVAPQSTLSVLERVLIHPATAEVLEECRRHLRLIRSLAYDPALFERCIALLVKVAESWSAESSRDEGADTIASLFGIHFSGTHASIEQRSSITTSLLKSESPRKRTLGLAALRATLETAHFSAGGDFEFGAHSRNYGYQPKCADDVKRWFAQALELAENLACSQEPVAPQVRNVLANQFRGLWTNAGMYDDLERVCRAISVRCFWKEGWIAVRQTIRFDSKDSTGELATRLSSLEALLRPKDLAQQVRLVVLTEHLSVGGLDSEDDKNPDDVNFTVQRIENMAQALGQAVAADEEILGVLLPEIVTGKGQLWSFGRGMAEVSVAPAALWDRLVSQLMATPASDRRPDVLGGLLNVLKEKDRDLVDHLLDDTTESETLAPFFPWFQMQVGIDEKGVDRLMRSLDAGKVPVRSYRNLIGGGATHKMRGRDLNSLLLRIAAHDGGLNTAIEILCMRISYASDQSSPSELVDIGCELMRRLTFAQRNTSDDYRIGIIAKRCLVGEQGAATVLEICRNLKDAISKSETYAFHHSDLLQTLLGIQPLPALEGIYGGDRAAIRSGISVLNQAGQLRHNPFDAIPEADLITWCDLQPEARYPAIAAGVTPFQWSGEAGRPQWTGIAHKLLQMAPDRVAVLKEFTARFVPGAWSGSRTAIVESNVRLLDELSDYGDPALVKFVGEEKARFADTVKTEHTMEFLLDRERDERFE